MIGARDVTAGLDEKEHRPDGSSARKAALLRVRKDPGERHHAQGIDGRCFQSRDAGGTLADSHASTGRPGSGDDFRFGRLCSLVVRRQQTTTLTVVDEPLARPGARSANQPAIGDCRSAISEEAGAGGLGGHGLLVQLGSFGLRLRRARCCAIPVVSGGEAGGSDLRWPSRTGWGPPGSAAFRRGGSGGHGGGGALVEDCRADRLHRLREG